MTGGFDRVYGPITLLVALLFWIWIAGVILLVGGQLVAHYQEILVDGEAPEAVEARHVDAKMLRTRPEGRGVFDFRLKDARTWREACFACNRCPRQRHPPST